MGRGGRERGQPELLEEGLLPGEWCCPEECPFSEGGAGQRVWASGRKPGAGGALVSGRS